MPGSRKSKKHITRESNYLLNRSAEDQNHLSVTNIKQEELAMATNEAYQAKQFKLRGLQGFPIKLSRCTSNSMKATSRKPTG